MSYNFAPISTRPGLISLAEAQRNPEIVYHSIKGLDPRPVVIEPFGATAFLTLLPLSVAAGRKDIKHRREGFEMKERALHLRLVRKRFL
ncbi:hypothetical protein PHLCEN_2v8590 [Hermanssonia centrifuga]|uniref:Uncharacterized protein n=1 Tax=Hermanssonia centrifuga TaxID=98765 RepID=A0A1U7KEF7_9APHY|nr:hypothetical protein PHLCEN_2v9294 [Hermanssonia centrifuga]PSR76225.1 hypothetical protein PHLCEN_2v8590 [Hermanssonia centrifuga]